MLGFDDVGCVTGYNSLFHKSPKLTRRTKSSGKPGSWNQLCKIYITWQQTAKMLFGNVKTIILAGWIRTG